MHLHRSCAAAALLLLAAGSAWAQSPSSNLYDGGGSVTLPFVNLISSGVEPTVNLGIGGGAYNSFTMDTGSVGILASRQYFTPGPDAKVLGPGIQTYTSDHKTEYGTWYETTQQFYDNNGNLVAEAKVPVMLVEKVVTCDASGTTCHTDTNPDTHMLGIGFAREGTSGQQDPKTHAPSYNAFLNLTAVAHTPGGPMVALPADWHNGYVIAYDQVQLGLTSNNTASAGFIKLRPDPTYYTDANKEWMAVKAAITVGTSPTAVTAEGTALMDSGLNWGIHTPFGTIGTFRCNGQGNADPQGAYDCANAGTHLAISLPNASLSIFQYDFSVGGSDPMAPPVVHVSSGSETFFNTSFYVFEGVNLIFDADHGFVGYQASSSSSGATPTINMWMALGGEFTIPDNFTSSLPLVLFAESTLQPQGVASFTGIISSIGNDRLIIDGPGRVVLAAANTYTGDTVVKRGTLSVNGSIVSKVIVDKGGVLGGTGQLGNVEVRAGGIYAPGNSIGTQTISGNLRFAPGGVLAIEVSPTNADKVVVFGSVDLTGAVLQVMMELDKYGPVTTREIIENRGPGPVIGEFAEIVNPLVFFRSSVSYTGGTGDDVVLTLTRRNDYSYVAETANEYAVARALEGLPADNPMIEALQLQTLDGALQAFNALSGEMHATIGSVLADQGRYVRQTLLGRLLQLGNGSGAGTGMASAAAPTEVAARPAGMMALGAGGDDWGASPGPRMADLVFWTKAYGAWGALDGNGNAATADRTLGGVLTGADTRLDQGWRAGFATGYAQSSISAGARNSSASVDTVNLAGYAGGPLGPAVLRSGAAWGWDSIDSSRSVAFPGFFEQEQASYRGGTGQVFAELALPGKWDQMLTEPFAGLAWVHVGTDGFAESGPLAGLTSTGSSNDVGYSTLGARVAVSAQIGGMEVTSRASVGWQHAFGDVSPEMALAFAAGGAPFVVGGVPLATDAALVEAGLGIALLEAGVLEVSYFGQLAADAHDNAVEGRFKWSF